MTQSSKKNRKRNAEER